LPKYNLLRVAEWGSLMVKTRYRSPRSYDVLNQGLYQSIFEHSPNAYLVLTPNLKIINGNDAFVKVTRIGREVFAGKYMFDAFPGNTEEENTGVQELMASWDRVLASKRTDMLKEKRYDVQNVRGIWETRIWNGTSWPVLDDKERITALVLGVNEIIKKNEVSEMIAIAAKAIERSNKLAAKVDELTRAIREGRLERLDDLRELLTHGSTMIH
jgi:PAS domain S-box-containing protein